MSVHPLLEAIWNRNIPIFRARLAQLDAAAAAALDGAQSGGLSPTQRQEAITNAHTLAGSLGTFGYPAGTDIARLLEQLLEAPGEPDAARMRELTFSLREIVGL